MRLEHVQPRAQPRELRLERAEARLHHGGPGRLAARDLAHLRLHARAQLRPHQTRVHRAKPLDQSHAHRQRHHKASAAAASTAAAAVS